MTTLASYKARGANWEKRIADFLKGERRRTHGKHDTGDIAGLPGIVVECKAQGRLELNQWILELQKEVDNANADLGFLVVKKQGSLKADKAYWLIDPRHVHRIIEWYYAGVDSDAREFG